MVTASTPASNKKAVKYQGTTGPSDHRSSVPFRLVSKPTASITSATPTPIGITIAAPDEGTSTVTRGPASRSTRKYRHDATPAPAPMPSEKSQTLCSDQRTGCGNIQRTRPNPTSQIAARHNNVIG